LMVSPCRRGDSRGSSASESCLREHAAGGDAGQVFVAVAEDLLQDLDRVFAEAGGGRTRSAVVAGDAELMPLVGNLAHLGMEEGVKEAGVMELRVMQVIARAWHHARRDAGGLQPQHEVAGWVTRGELRELGVDQRALRAAAGGRVELRGRRPRGVAERGAQ